MTADGVTQSDMPDDRPPTAAKAWVAGLPNGGWLRGRRDVPGAIDDGPPPEWWDNTLEADLAALPGNYPEIMGHRDEGQDEWDLYAEARDGESAAAQQAKDWAADPTETPPPPVGGR